MIEQNENNILKGYQSDDDQSNQYGFRIPTLYQQHKKINSYQDLNLNFQLDQQFIKKYQPWSLIYSSTTSFIIEALHKTLKVKKNQSQQNKQLNNFEKVVVKISINPSEIEILTKLNSKQHCNSIIEFIEKYQNIIVLQNCRGSLRDILNQELKILQNGLILKIMQNCLEGLIFLKKFNIVHNDIKPDNILFRQKNKRIERFLLTDFGMSFQIDQNSQKNVFNSLTVNKRQQQLQQEAVSWQYIAPQCLSELSQKGTSIDVWGLGCVLFECITGEALILYPVNSLKNYQKMLQKYATRQEIQKRLENQSYKSQIELFRELLISMLSLNPSLRPTLQQLKTFIRQNYTQI